MPAPTTLLFFNYHEMNNVNLVPKWWLLLFCYFASYLSTTPIEAIATDHTGTISGEHYSAYLNFTYETHHDNVAYHRPIVGYYGYGSIIDHRKGTVVHVRSTNNKTDGCSPLINNNIPSSGEWIALIQRGDCSFQTKITNAALKNNASAVVIYNNEADEDEKNGKKDRLVMNDKVDRAVSVFISQPDGEKIAKLVDNGTKVTLLIEVGKIGTTGNNINKTSVLFVSISFIVLMIISLAWLVFYYIQRFRYAHAKERLSKRLMNAAKKAITKMPVRTVRSGDKETDSEFDQCAVCIEGYRSTDVIRTLPCKHLFHKSCVDPWLIEQRSCPMCKLDILKAYGLQIHGSRESVNMDGEVLSTSTIGGATPIHISADIIDSEPPARENLEVVRYQPTPPDNRSTTLSPDGDTCANNDEDTEPTADSSIRALVIPTSMCESMESVHSIDSEATELQSLMPENVVVSSPNTSLTISASIHDSQRSLNAVSVL